jgi:hypothetical protein
MFSLMNEDLGEPFATRARIVGKINLLGSIGNEKEQSKVTRKY